jgi:hypothetical protein
MPKGTRSLTQGQILAETLIWSAFGAFVVWGLILWFLAPQGPSLQRDLHEVRDTCHHWQATRKSYLSGAWRVSAAPHPCGVDLSPKMND